MKLLGRGWQYSVYDLENGRVIKKMNSRFLAYLQMLKGCFPYTKLGINQFPKMFQASVNMATNSIRSLKKISFDKKLLGNPKFFENSLEYEQDKIIPVEDYLKTISVEEGKKAIDEFYNFNINLISLGFIDKSFAIAKNFGIDHQGKIILSDLGELYFSPELRNQIQKRPWAANYVIKPLPKNLRNYFVEKMDRLLTSS